MTRECFYCDRDATGIVSPPMCERHHDFYLLRAIVAHKQMPITVENLQAAYTCIRFRPAFNITEIAALLENTIRKQQEHKNGQLGIVKSQLNGQKKAAPPCPGESKEGERQSNNTTGV